MVTWGRGRLPGVRATTKSQQRWWARCEEGEPRETQQFMGSAVSPEPMCEATIIVREVGGNGR